MEAISVKLKHSFSPFYPKTESWQPWHIPEMVYSFLERSSLNQSAFPPQAIHLSFLMVCSRSLPVIPDRNLLSPGAFCDGLAITFLPCIGSASVKDLLPLQITFSTLHHSRPTAEARAFGLITCNSQANATWLDAISQA